MSKDSVSVSGGSSTKDVLMGAFLFAAFAFLLYRVYWEAGIFTCLFLFILLVGFMAVNKNLTKEIAIREIQNELLAARLNLKDSPILQRIREERKVN